MKNIQDIAPWKMKSSNTGLNLGNRASDVVSWMKKDSSFDHPDLVKEGYRIVDKIRLHFSTPKPYSAELERVFEEIKTELIELAHEYLNRTSSELEQGEKGQTPTQEDTE